MGGEFQQAYTSALQSYLASRVEPALRAAYELGREAVRKELGVLDLADTHHRAHLAALRALSGEDDAESVSQAAMTFFMEALSSFEMVHRGFREAHERALLEKEHSDQLGRLVEASLTIGATLSRAEIARVMADEVLGVTEADCGFAYLEDEGEASIIPSALCERCRQYLVAADLGGLQELVAGSSQAVGLSAMDLRRYGPWRAVEGEEAGPVSLAASLVGRRRVLGGLYILHRRGSELAAKDRWMLVQLAHVGSAALENARLYEEQRQTAEALQRALLPARLPELPGIELTARYLPGGVGVEVGGDWYDVVELEGGRLAVAIGDVVGQGVRAASSMGQVRMAFRACLDPGSPPGAVVQRMNRLMCTLEPGHFSTMAYLVVDPSTGDCLMVTAGHPPPLLLEADGGVRYAEVGRAMALGVEPTAEFPHGRISLGAGSTLLLYTDGLLGRHLDSPRELAGVVAGAPSDLDELCDRVLEALLPEELQDDVALLALRLSPA